MIESVRCAGSSMLTRLRRCIILAMALLILSCPCISSDAAERSPSHPIASGELDRIAHAVEGKESSFGKNPRMWRADPEGPQGPMQLSRAAAVDVGDGDRFDE